MEFIVKEGTTFGLTEAEANSNYVTVNPDGSSDYTHTFTSGTTDSDGNTVLRTSPTLDVTGEPLAANQNYNIYVLNMAKTPHATENSLSSPSNTFTITSVGVYENTKVNEVSVYPVPNNGSFKIKLNPSNTIEQIHLLDITGKLVEDLTDKKSSSLIELSGVQSGAYILNVKSKTGNKSYKVNVLR
ncbi:MAG: T9SS type A sorting domain-containing protein [Bacteroidia bacterium]